ncbi:MAG: hypothetical protein OXK79_01665 [Chloroflexota bacterium]|nr:hypothetical protein [Chloroflexota bacterium]
MATVNFSVPDDLKTDFNETYEPPQPPTDSVFTSASLASASCGYADQLRAVFLSVGLVPSACVRRMTPTSHGNR